MRVLVRGRHKDEVLHSLHVDLCLDIYVSELDLNVIYYVIYVLDCDNS